MGKKAAKSQQDAPTVRAVVKLAAELREKAQRHASAHPGERDLYAPSEKTARNVASALGPQAALVELERRALRTKLLLDAEMSEAKRARARLRTHQLAAGDVRALQRGKRTLGQRLDDVLRGLDLLSETSAVRLDSEPVKGSKADSGGPVPLRRQRERDALAEDAQRIVASLERELAWSTRRLVEEEEAAAA